MDTVSDSSKAHTTRLIIVLCLAQFCISADIATMAIATSALIAEFNSNVEALKVASTIYPLIGASLMLTSGILGLYIGWRRLLICGLVFGVMASISKLYAPSIEWITMVSRTLSGLAGVAILPSSIALVIGHFQPDKRAKVFGLLAASTGLAAAIVPIVSGWMFDNLSWFSGFVATGIFYGVALMCAIGWITPLANQKPKKFDSLGSVLSACSMLFIIFGLLKSPEWGVLHNNSPYDLPVFLSFLSPAIWILIGGITLFAWFIEHEKKFEQKHDSALVPSSWFHNKQFLLGVIILISMYVIFGGLNFSLVAFLQIAIDLSALQTGMIILVFAISLIVFSIITPIAFKQFNEKYISLCAFALCCGAAGLAWLCSSAYEVNRLIYLAMTIFGAGIGMLSSQSLIIITKAVGEKEAERVGGVQATLRNIGIAIGVSVIAGAGQATMEHKIRNQVVSQAQYSHTIQQAVGNSLTIPYITDSQLTQYLFETNIPKSEHSTLLMLNAESRLINFHSSIWLLFLVGLIGIGACSRLAIK
ncbi:MFS transporter [Vibrio crassostreae]|uniref:MFS transporter n=1 Tax=Vibrio crassostreae TaxID=246167 RepID=UPI000F46A0DB|nr:MFS transporter [Vibrio crassostreae]ROP10988.1 MFS transporter [Vibrio crassostreae]ROP15144.1 MFS transporter [Vibrio crassostreae]RPE88238.1 MFS transporter [Vibrio crassostreae]TCN62767.1 MFS transporter [Vibrio crassostreae]TCV05691.1 MFS transporter [Vibrio crassostreae]